MKQQWWWSVFLRKSMSMEVDEGDMNELIKEHYKELTTEELKELNMQGHTKVSGEIGTVEEVIPTLA